MTVGIVTNYADMILIASINDEKQVIYIKYVLTHAEYDKDSWKNDPYF
ncbi:type II toxin-antitoxin system HigB family toxin [Nostoc sp.]